VGTIFLLLSLVSILQRQQPSQKVVRFDFILDVRLFTTYTSAGNDGEWYSAGMHLSRIAV
jgi:hypothetical protein